MKKNLKTALIAGCVLAAQIVAVMLIGCTKPHTVAVAPSAEAPRLPAMSAPLHGVGNACKPGERPVLRRTGAMVGKAPAGDRFVPIRDAQGLIVFTEVCRKDAFVEVGTNQRKIVGQGAHELVLAIPITYPPVSAIQNPSGACNPPRKQAGSVDWTYPNTIQPMGDQLGVVYGSVFTGADGKPRRETCK